jgi:CubicO group peptidase (beta-lactamase class C family)
MNRRLSNPVLTLFPLLPALAVLAGLLCAVPSAGRAAGAGFEWQTATPESQGMSREKLDALKDGLAARNTRAFLVVRNDRIVYEWYAETHGPAKPHGTASLAKAIVGGLSLAVAMTDGRIALDDKAARYVPQWAGHPVKSKIEIRHLGSHTSGMEDSSVPGIAHPNEPGWKGEFWKRHNPPDDPFSISRDQTPLLFEPGEKFQYSNPGIAMLTYAVTAALRDAPVKDVRTLLRERVMRPIGAADAEWSVGYGRTFTVDGLPLVGSWGGGNFTARAAARIGRLVLREGDWDGARLLSREAVRQMTASAGLPGHCGMGWWTNAGGRYARVPTDAVWGAGAGDQILLVVPSLNLIMVRNGGALAPAGRSSEDSVRAKVLFEPLIGAVLQAPRGASRPPYPPSPVITRATWAPAESIVRKARGCDNWPLTWADDGHLYGAYGDGNGFEPFLPTKLSMGFARIEGGPDAFSGVNIRSQSGETKGDGAKGPKASGMLMVDGVLYMLARNAGNSQLAWSTDHGKTWTWADWKFTTSFGCPTFLNFGKNYAGARGEYVYVYSPDHDSAYLPADRMVLARVPKDRVRDRSAYEFLKSVDSGNNPVWTRDIDERGAVFTHPGRCYRTGISYDAGLKRYLWCHVLPESTDARGPRFQGGFGVYDAPEPWGPWTTVYFADPWDVGPGETASFPTKWMSPDGRTLHLVFSGDDHFSVRRVTLEVRGGEK